MIYPFYCILVNWNLREDTLACVDSLIAAGQPPEQIIVVDNGSSDGSVTALQERYRGALWIIENPTNVGFAQAANQGLARAFSAGAAWMFLLNNDTVVDQAIFNALTGAHQDHPGYKLLAPVILFFDEPERIWFFGDRLVGQTLITQSMYKGQRLDQPLAEVTPVDFLNGCGMFIHREVINSVELFDENLYMYGEEVDFFWRARVAGFKSATVSPALMWHKVSRSARRLKPEMRFYRIRNQIIFYRRYARGLVLPVMFLFTILRCLRITVQDLLSRQPGLIGPLVRAWISGWFGRTPAPSYGKSQL